MQNFGIFLGVKKLVETMNPMPTGICAKLLKCKYDMTHTPNAIKAAIDFSKIKGILKNKCHQQKEQTEIHILGKFHLHRLNLSVKILGIKITEICIWSVNWRLTSLVLVYFCYFSRFKISITPWYFNISSSNFQILLISN